MSLMDHRGVGSALRMLGLGRRFYDAFDFLDEPVEQVVIEETAVSQVATRHAIAEMRQAASRLSCVANALVVQARPTARQSIEEVTDEAVDFHA